MHAPTRCVQALSCCRRCVPVPAADVLRFLAPQLTVDLLPGDALNVDDPLPAVHLGHLALTALHAMKRAVVCWHGT